MIWKVAVGILVTFVLIFLASFRIRSTAHVDHTFNAPVEKVWALWSDPEAMKKWWGPHKYTAPTVQSDLRPEGKFLLSMLSPSNDINYNAGIYKEVITNEKITAETFFSDENGNRLVGDQIRVPGNWPDVTKVTTTFESKGSSTHVTVAEEGVPLIMKFLAQVGWNQQFEKMETVLSSK